MGAEKISGFYLLFLVAEVQAEEIQTVLEKAEEEVLAAAAQADAGKAIFFNYNCHFFRLKQIFGSSP